MSSFNFFDYNSTTPVAKEVLEKMLPYFSDVFANPSGQTSPMSWQSQSAINKAKKQIADTINCDPDEVYFTSGATESINWVLKNFMDESHPIFISPLDHDASFVTSKEYKNTNYFDPLSFTPALKPSLYSFILVNNETGQILDLKNNDSLKKEKHFIHIDATQAIGKIKVDFKSLNADFLSLSAHKFYGPKGIGALIIKKKTITNFKPFIFGGGQQSGLRSGTLNTPLIVGMGAAAELALKNYQKTKSIIKIYALNFYKK